MDYNLIGFNFGVVFIVLLVFGVLQWLHIPVGSFVDWVIAVAIFEWLLVIVTVPWNVHFEAKEVLAQANESIQNEIPVDNQQINYVKRVAQISLWGAIGLHLASAIGLYLLATAGISLLGYISSVAALLLTFLRPTIRAYQYLAVRLAMIRQQVNYPREDIQELRNRFAVAEENIKNLEAQLNLEDPRSWVATQQRDLEAIRNDLTRFAAAQEQLKVRNDAEHERLSREAQQAIAQLTIDSQFLDHVREIIRFFKAA